MSESRSQSAWLVLTSGPHAGKGYPVSRPVTTVGRGPENDVSITDSPTVSVRHFEILRNDGEFRIRDLNSTNGTLVDGQRVNDAALQPPCRIRLGDNGPELTFLLELPAEVGAGPVIDRTIQARRDSVLPEGDAGGLGPAPAKLEHEDLLIEAVAASHLTRRKGIGNETLTLMRHTLHKAVHRTRRKFVAIITLLAVCLIGVSAYGAWKIRSLKGERDHINNEIRNIESRLQNTNPGQAEASELYDRLNDYESRARNLEGDLLYRVTVRKPADPVETEIKSLLAEFGAETYTVPLEFLEQTKQFIEKYQGPDRPNIERGLGEARSQIDIVRGIFEQEHLPADLAYMSIVESALRSGNSSPAGSAGLWQFTSATAKAYGLNVSPGNDERLDTRKSTRAACRYIRELILDFGAGSSVMLALAAYNSGPTKVKQAIRRVTDPIKQRNFWYLYRVRALPDETREFVPKVIAVLIIARSPERFGF